MGCRWCGPRSVFYFFTNHHEVALCMILGRKRAPLVKADLLARCISARQPRVCGITCVILSLIYFNRKLPATRFDKIEQYIFFFFSCVTVNNFYFFLPTNFKFSFFKWKKENFPFEKRNFSIWKKEKKKFFHLKKERNFPPGKKIQWLVQKKKNLFAVIYFGYFLSAHVCV